MLNNPKGTPFFGTVTLFMNIMFGRFFPNFSKFSNGPLQFFFYRPNKLDFQKTQRVSCFRISKPSRILSLRPWPLPAYLLIVTGKSLECYQSYKKTFRRLQFSGETLTVSTNNLCCLVVIMSKQYPVSGFRLRFNR